MSPPARRSARRSAGSAAAKASEHLERSESWHGLRVGDPVMISGLRIRGDDWEFRAHVLNRHNGTESIEVVGGRSGDRRVRSFEPHRIFPATGSGRHGSRRTSSDRSISDQPSLADAPQLPFG
ncbi:MAG: hypothetical protein ACREC5_07670 [Thermoplasmata archaeon]